MKTTPVLAAAALLALAGCQPAPLPPDPTGRASADMVRVLTAYQQLGAKPVYQVTVEQARTQATPGQAAAQVAVQMGQPEKIPVARVADITVDGGAGPLTARIYDPQQRPGPAPVILYFHGGGWVIGDLDTYDASDRALAQGTGAIVLSVQYRRGPETRFPGAHEDAAAAYSWLLAHAQSIGGDPRQVALAGESAGGNLAIDTAVFARDHHLPMPVHELLVYPVAGTDLNTPSYRETANAAPLNRRAIEWYVARYTNGASDLQDSRLNLVGAADLRGLPPTTIISAEIDPLRSEGEMLAQKLQAAGVPVVQRTYPGVTHEFFGMGGALAAARQAEDLASMRLKASFTQPAAPAAPVPPPRARRGRR